MLYLLLFIATCTVHYVYTVHCIYNESYPFSFFSGGGDSCLMNRNLIYFCSLRKYVSNSLTKLWYSLMGTPKPCPFCGGRACKEVSKHHTNPSVFIIRCNNTDCSVRPMVAKTSEERAIKAWNTECNTF